MWALRASSVFDGDAFLPGGAVLLIDDGRIVAVLGADEPLPDGCEVVRHQGTVLPGLIDTHTHLVGDSELGALDRVAGYTDDELAAVVRESLRRHLAAGVTAVRDLGDRRFAVADRSPRPGEPTVVVAGPPITSPGGHCFYLGGEVDGPAAIRSAIAQRVEHGVGIVKVMASGGMLTPGTDQLGSQFSDDDLRLIVDLSHRAGLPVTAHAHALVAVRQAVAAGVDGIEHCTCLTERGPVVDGALLDALAAAGVTVCATAGGDIRLLGPTPPHIAALLDRMGVGVEDVFGRRGEFLSRAHAAGVRLVCGVDSGISHIKAHGSIAASMSDHVAAGIPVAEVLAAATSVSAEDCGLSGKGRIRVGADADLLLVDGDPRTDIAALTRVGGVVLAGVLVIGPGPADPAGSGRSARH
jgi:imidazolonepropionase-like amidohydrolase